MKRYNIHAIPAEDPSGDWCKWEDVEELVYAGATVAEADDKSMKRIAELETENIKLREALKTIADRTPLYGPVSVEAQIAQAALEEK